VWQHNIRNYILNIRNSSTRNRRVWQPLSTFAFCSVFPSSTRNRRVWQRACTTFAFHAFHSVQPATEGCGNFLATTFFWVFMVSSTRNRRVWQLLLSRISIFRICMFNPQ